MTSSSKRQTRFVYFIAAIAAFGGLLFGYDTGVISGAILFIKDSFVLTEVTEGFIIGAVLLGALLGSGLAGKISDRFGRRKVIIATAILFIFASLFCAMASSINMLIVGRFILGIAIGVASFTAPLYIAEVAPYRYRGALVSLNQLAITIGILSSYFIDYGFSHVNYNWRWMLGLGLIPAIILLLGMLILPESPRWMMLKGFNQRARNILKLIREENTIDSELAEIARAVNAKTINNIGVLKAKWLRPAIVIGFGLAFLQQMTGINTIIYYAPTIFKMAGIHSSDTAILVTSIVGTCNVVFTIIGMLLVDRLGRRPLLFIGISGMAISLFCLAFSFFTSAHSILLQWLTLGSMLVYIASFASSLGIMVWIILAEVFPLEIRGLGMSLATACTWGFNFIVSFTFLILVKHFGVSNTFFIYGLLCLGGLIFINGVVPETKGISLEYIEENLRLGKSARELGLQLS